MKKQKCVVCNKTKGKRGCKLNDSMLVCPVCCAEIRSSECEGCSYYKAAEKYKVSKFQNTGDKKFLINVDESIDSEVDKALELVEKDQMDQALAILEVLYEKHPEYHMVQYGMGILNAFKKNNDKAIECFKKAIEIFPYFVEAHFNLGVAYQKKLDMANTVLSMQKVVEIGNPGEPHVMHAKKMMRNLEQSFMKNDGVSLDDYMKNQSVFEHAVAEMEAGRLEHAIEGFMKSLKVMKNHPQSHGNLGICLAKLGKKEEALKAFDKTLEIDPAYEVAAYNKSLTEKLKEGEVLGGKIGSVDYYKERFVHERKE